MHFENFYYLPTQTYTIELTVLTWDRDRDRLLWDR